MPAKSKAQQRFMGMVHALQKGEIKPSDVSDKVKKAADSMSDKDAEDFASTKHKGLPKKVKEALLRENPAAAAAAAMVMIQMQNPDTGNKVKAITPLRNKDHKLHGKAKGIFKRLKDKFSKKSESVEEGFGGDLKGSDKKKFEKARKENAEQLGYELTGTSDIKESVNENAQKVAKLLIKRGNKPNRVKDMVKKHYKKAKKDRSKAGPSDLASYISFLSANESVNEGINDKMKKIMTKLAKSLRIKSVVDMYTGKGSLSYFLDDEKEALKLQKFLQKSFKRVRKINLDKSKGDTANFVVAADMLGLESVNEADLKSQMKAEMDKVKKHREAMRKHSGKDKDKADRALARMKAAQVRVDKLQDKIIGIKKESVNEAGLEMNKLKDAIKMFQKKIKKQGRVTNARDEEHLKNLIKVYKQMGGKGVKESVNEVSGVDVAKKVLKNKQREKGIDLQTANLIVTIDKAYDKNPKLQKKFRAIQLPKMKQLIMKYYG